DIAHKVAAAGGKNLTIQMLRAAQHLGVQNGLDVGKPHGPILLPVGKTKLRVQTYCTTKRWDLQRGSLKYSQSFSIERVGFRQSAQLTPARRADIILFNRVKNYSVGTNS